MKLAFFHNLPPGGAKRVLFEQIIYLSKNHLVDVYELSSSEDDFLDAINLKCKIYSIPFVIKKQPHNPLSALTADFKNFVILASVHKRLAQRINNKGYDFVIVHPDKYTQAPFLLKYLTVKNLYYCHEWLRIVYEKQFAFTEKVSFPKRFYEQMTRSMRQKVDFENAYASYLIVANSEYTAQHVLEVYNRKAIVSSPGVDTSVFYPKKEKKDIDILFIGEENVIEGFDLLQNTLELFNKKPVVKIVSRRASQMWLSDTELADLYRRSQIVVALSRNEPFGLIPLEAMACATPVVAIKQGGYKETIEEGNTGFLVEPTPLALKTTLDKLLLNPKLAEKMGKAGAKSCKKEWSITLKNKQLEEIILDE